MTQKSKELSAPKKEVLRRLGTDLVHLSMRTFESTITRWVIIVFGVICIGYPLFRIVQAYLVVNSILISIPLTYLMIVGAVALRVAYAWGRPGGD